MATIESLSSPLRERLLTLGLCSERDLRRCRPHVRRLARDLPAFDSVWLDALVQTGALTPFQVRQLESDRPERLTCCPCVLVAQLAAGTHGGTFLARQPPAPGFTTVKFIDCPDSRAGELIARLRDLIAILRTADSANLGRFSHCEPTSAGCALISPHAEGPSAAELLVRRGRFPSEVVSEIARQLLSALATLERVGVVHGDVRPANVRLRRDGLAVLVDGGLRPLLSPVETVHSGLPPEHYDGIAPELINTLNPPTHQSDLYALGCLLWQLLAGRPPFPAGDPLVKLAAHQARAVPPLEEVAPETPAPLRWLVGALLERDPSRRPKSASRVLAECQASGPEAPGRLRRFRREFDHPRQLRRPTSAGRWPRALLAIALLGAIGWWWPRPGANPAGPDNRPAPNRSSAAAELSQSQSPHANTSEAEISPSTSARAVAPGLAGPVTQSAADADTLRSTAGVTRSGTPATPPGSAVPDGRASAVVPASERGALAELPAPDEQGELLLPAGGVYLARRLEVVGPLSIRGTGTPPPRLVVREPWRVVAETFRLEGVELKGELAPGPDPEATLATLDLHAQSLRVRQVQFSTLPRSSTLGSAPPSVRWELVDNRDTRPTVADFQACQFHGGAAVLVLPQPVSNTRFANCLMTSQDVLVELAGSSRRTRQVTIRLDRVTARGGGGVLRWWGEEGPPAGLQVALELKSSVIAGDSNSLVTCISQRRWGEWRGRVRVTGDGALVSPEWPLIAWQSDSTGERREFDGAGFTLEGLSAVPLDFVGTRLEVPGDSVLRSALGPRRSAELPGIDPRAWQPAPSLLAN
ncbi:MAG: serine/threonine protein kinase [Planctomycetaceae bacterium]